MMNKYGSSPGLGPKRSPLTVKDANTVQRETADGGATHDKEYLNATLKNDGKRGFRLRMIRGKERVEVGSRSKDVPKLWRHARALATACASELRTNNKLFLSLPTDATSSTSTSIHEIIGTPKSREMFCAILTKRQREAFNKVCAPTNAATEETAWTTEKKKLGSKVQNGIFVQHAKTQHKICGYRRAHKSFHASCESGSFVHFIDLIKEQASSFMAGNVQDFQLLTRVMSQQASRRMCAARVKSELHQAKSGKVVGVQQVEYMLGFECHIASSFRTAVLAREAWCTIAGVDFVSNIRERCFIPTEEESLAFEQNLQAFIDQGHEEMTSMDSDVEDVEDVEDEYIQECISRPPEKQGFANLNWLRKFGVWTCESSSECKCRGWMHDVEHAAKLCDEGCVGAIYVFKTPLQYLNGNSIEFCTKSGWTSLSKQQTTAMAREYEGITTVKGLAHSITRALAKHRALNEKQNIVQIYYCTKQSHMLEMQLLDYCMQQLKLRDCMKVTLQTTLGPKKVFLREQFLLGTDQLHAAEVCHRYGELARQFAESNPAMHFVGEIELPTLSECLVRHDDHARRKIVRTHLMGASTGLVVDGQLKCFSSLDQARIKTPFERAAAQLRELR